MNKKLFVIMFFMLSGLLPSTAMAEIKARDHYWVPGFTVGSRIGMRPRSGFDLSLMNVIEQGTGITSCGGVVGAAGSKPLEYYVGGACGLVYLVSVRGEATVTIVESKPTGVRALAAIGAFLMPYVALGYDIRAPLRAYGELGVTFKFPLIF